MFRIRYIVWSAVVLAIVAKQVGAAEADDRLATREKERALIEVLQSAAPPQDKAITCKHLAIYGGKDAIPALAPLLSDEELASWAPR